VLNPAAFNPMVMVFDAISVRRAIYNRRDYHVSPCH
jgi:hypothetical protein